MLSVSRLGPVRVRQMSDGARQILTRVPQKKMAGSVWEGCLVVIDLDRNTRVRNQSWGSTGRSRTPTQQKDHLINETLLSSIRS